MQSCLRETILFEYELLEPYTDSYRVRNVAEHLYPVNNYLETIRTICNMHLREWQLSNPVFEFTSLVFLGP